VSNLSNKEKLEKNLNVAQLGKQGGFNLSMAGFNLKDGIGFITKFTKVFSEIKAIDFGNNELAGEDLNEFNETLKMNKYIQNVVMKKKGANKG
jgi:hypothetical protein